MRRVVVVLAVLLAVPLLAAAEPSKEWDDVAGGPHRTGAAFLPSATLDILGSRDLGFPEDTIFSLSRAKGLVATPHGLVGLAYNGDGECIHVIASDDAVRQAVLDPCVAATMEGYDRSNDRIFLCSQGGPDEHVFQARDAGSGEFAWGIRPSDLSLEGEADTRWDCNGSALDAGLGVVYVVIWSINCAGFEGVGSACPPSSSASLVRVQAADGTIEWVAPISAQAFYAEAEFTVDGIGYENQGAGFAPHGLSLVDGGVVVSGRTTCTCGKGDGSVDVPRTEQGAVAWFDAADGDMIGSVQAEDDVSGTGVRERYLGPWWTPTQGPLTGFALGDRVMVVNYAEGEPVRQAPFQGIETGEGFIGVLPSAWWGDTLLVPMGESVTAVDSQSLETQWSWTKADQWRVSAMAVVPPSDVWVLVVQDHIEDGPMPASMHRLDLETGEELQRLDVPGPIFSGGGLGRAQFQPMEDGTLLVYTTNGQIYTFGTADPAKAPPVKVSDDYPAIVDPTTIDVRDPDPAVNYSIAWGDGQLDSGGTSWTHRYGKAGDRVVRITATYADGTTATTEHVIHVGAERPRELNAIQTAFAPENQDMTWGIIGVIVAFFGGIGAYAVRAYRRQHIAKDLRHLEAIRRDGAEDPLAALAMLRRYRKDLRERAASGKLEGAQYTSLAHEADKLERALEQRLLAHFQGRLGAPLQHALEVALADGALSAKEREELLLRIPKAKGLTKEERASFSDLLAQW